MFRGYNMKKKILLIFICILLIGTLIPAAATTHQSEITTAVSSTDNIDWWPQFKHDPQHTGFSTSKGPETANVLWTYSNTSCGTIGDGVAVVDNRVYAASSGIRHISSGALFCLNTSNGAELWSYTFPYEEGNYYSVFGSPTVMDGKVYVCTFGHEARAVGHAFCFDAVTGALIWKSQETGFCLYGATAANGKIYFGTNRFMDSNSSLFCLSAETGVQLWEKKFRGNSCIDGSPVVFGDNVYVGVAHEPDAGTYCFNASTGEKIWVWQEENVEEDVTASLAIINGKVYFGTQGAMFSVNNIPVRKKGNMYCVDALNGTLQWNGRLQSRGQYVFSSPCLAYGNVFVCNSAGFNANRNGKLVCLNDQGYIVWQKKHLSFSSLPMWYISGGGMGTPTVADNKVYLGTAGFFRSHLYCFNVTSGKQIWKYSFPTLFGSLLSHGEQFPPSSYFCAPAIVNGRLYTAWSDSSETNSIIYCFGDT